MKIRATTFTVLLTLAIASTALSSEIYKWTDEDGNVHYGDRPLGDDPELMSIESQPTDPARIQALAQARTETRLARADAESQATADGPSEEELMAEAQERAEKCSANKERMQRFVRSRRLYREDENGERVYLDEEQMLEARQRVEDQITEYCDS